MTDLGDQRMPFMMNGTFRFNDLCPSEHGMKFSHTKGLVLASYILPCPILTTIPSLHK